MKWEGEGLKILDFDMECRPLSYLGSDYTTDEVTAIAAGWAHEKEIHVWCLGIQCQHGNCTKYHHGSRLTFSISARLRSPSSMRRMASRNCCSTLPITPALAE